MRSVDDYYTFTPNDRQRYGAQRDNGRKHRGTDISYSTTPGTAVPALLGGTVHSIVAPSSSHGFGHQTVTSVQLGSKRYHVSYEHGCVAPPVRKGQRFSAGAKVLEEGRTGATNGSCMHLEVFDVAQGVFINPMPFIKQVLSAGTVASLGSATLLPTQRLVTSASLNRRRTPGRRFAPLPDPLKRGAVGNFVGWRRGERVNGNEVWFQGTSGDWFHSGGLDGGSRTTGLKNLNPAASTAPRTVTMLEGSMTVNGRSRPQTSAPVRQKLRRGVVGTFDGHRVAQKVTQNGVTSDIWFRGAFKGNWFWAGNFIDRSTTGLPAV